MFALVGLINTVFIKIGLYIFIPKITLIKFRNVEHRDEMTASLVYSPGIGCWRPEWVASVQSQWFNIGYLDGTKNMNGITVGIRWNN